MRPCRLAVLLFASGCAVQTPTLGSDRQGILGGTEAKVGQFPSVVAVVETQAGYLCTGSLISPTAILTAGHCVDPTEIGTTAADILRDTVVLFDEVVADGQSGTVATPSQIFENPNHPDYSTGNDLGHDDDAIIILSQPISDRAPIPIDLDPSHDLVGVTTTQVGYGVDAIKNGSGDQSTGGTEFVLTGKPTIDCSPYGVTNQNMICFDQTDDKGQCNGDSGGPAIDPNGVEIGIVSFGDQGCVQFGADSRPSQSAAFITSHVPDLTTNTTGSDGGGGGGGGGGGTTGGGGGGGDGGGGGGGATAGGDSGIDMGTSGCAAGGSPSLAGALLLVGVAVLRRRRATAA